MANSPPSPISSVADSELSINTRTRTSSSSGGPQSNWLLRLFQSHFFDSRLALSYLHRYPDSIGIQHYICNRLEEFGEEDLEFFLPQLCHLLISRPTESVALENFLLKQCRASNHAAILTLWYLQSHLNDMRGTPNTETFRLCQRLYHKCQVTVFADAPRTKDSTWTSFKDFFPRKKMRENVRPAVVGIGAVLAAGVCPLVVEAGAGMILSQGHRWKSLGPDADTTADQNVVQTSLAARRSESVKDNRETERGLAKGMERRHSTEGFSMKHRGLALLARIPTASATPDELSRGGAFSFSRYVAKTSGSYPAKQSLSLSDDSLDRGVPLSPTGASQSESILARSDPQHLHSSHYFHSELQFMMTLVEISDRLRTVPKDARQSTLVAELALLNHNLPANVCMPPWCNARKSHTVHHRVARISPSDAVVLNSADRVPFLVTVEVLDPPGSRRDLSTDGGNQQDDLEDDSSHIVPLDPISRTESSANLDGKTEQEPIAAIKDANAADYHRTVIHRRKSVASFSSQVSISPKNDVILESKESLEGRGHINSVSAMVDEFSERMRTAAVMLAQLYQQQQRELLAQSSTAPTTSVTPSEVVVGAGGLPAHLARTIVPQSNAGSPTSPVIPKDRRNYQRLHTDFEQIRNRLIKEMVTLEEKRMEALAVAHSRKHQTPLFVEGATDEVLPEKEEQALRKQCQERDKDDPSAAVFQETWHARVQRIRESSPFGNDPNWRLLSVIVKSGADLRQEQLALQLIKEMQRIWREANVPVWVCYFRILITSDQSGLIETVRDAISVHSIKKNAYAKQLNEKGLAFTLYDYFVKEFGHPGSTRFLQAQDNFMRSLAAYSVICYLLQIKDRHNGNILLDIQGHIIHIDFGFMLSNSPGSLGFELAPFKMPQEYVDILGGIGSEKFDEFRSLMKEAFLATRKKAGDILGLVEMMEHGSSLPCFTGASSKPSNVPAQSVASTSAFLSVIGSEGDMSMEAAAATSTPASNAGSVGKYPVTAALRERFHLSLTEMQIGTLVDQLIDRSCGSAYTRLYDSFQYYANGIL